MFFKNLLIYTLTQPVDFTSIEEALKNKLAKPCDNQEMATIGFIPPLGDENAPLVRIGNGFCLIAAQKEERILPSSVVKEAVNKKVSEIEKRDNRKVYRKEKDQLKDEVIQSLIGQAFTRKTVTYAAINLSKNMIYVDSSSVSKAEELLSALRECLESLPVRPVTTKIAISTTLTHWLKDQHASHGFHLLEDCELRDTHENGGIIRCKRQDLTTDEILNHIKSGKIATKLALSWNDKLTFILDDKLSIKRIKFSDILLEEADKEGGDDAAGQFDATFIMQMLTFAEFIPSLLTALGGENIPE